MSKLKILAFAGSLRADSVNRKLIKWAVDELKNMDYEVTFIDIRDYPLPLYNPDITLEEFPKNAVLLANLMQDHQAWLISSPEYNYSIPSCLKNLIDFVSRAPENKPNLTMFADKIIGLMSASPSIFGGNRGLRHLRDILSSIGSLIIPTQANIPNAFSAFDEHGNLIEINGQKAVRAVLTHLTNLSSKIIK